MTPLRVRATMAAPIAIPHSHDVHLDALLAWVWMLRHYPNRLGLLGREAVRANIIQAHLPVAQLHLGEHHVPLCGAWTFPAEARLSTMRWTRRKDGSDMAQRARQVSGSSPDRPQFNRGDSVETPWVEWICWGQRCEVRKSLQLVHHVGGLRAHGHGEIARWDIEEGDHDPVATWVAAGRAVRNLPSEAVDGATAERLAVEPPYWVPCMQVPAVRVGELVALRPGIEEQIRAATS